MTVKICPAVEIERLDNGYVCHYHYGGEDGESGSVTYEDNNADELWSFIKVLFFLLEFYDKTGKRDDEWRIRVIRAHGDKWEAPKKARKRS